MKFLKQNFCVILFYAMTTLFITGCSGTAINSSLNPKINIKKITRLYILFDEDKHLETSFILKLKDHLKIALKEYGISGMTQTRPILTLDESIFIKEIKSFSSDAVLTIHAGSRRGMNAIMWHATLYDAEMNHIIWYSEIQDWGGTIVYSRRMADVANSIFAKLKEDGLL